MKYYFIGLFCILQTLSFSQISISGKILDYSTNEPVQYPIIFWDSSSSFSVGKTHIKGMQCNKDGTFKIDSITTKCNINLSIQMVGNDYLLIKNIPISKGLSIDLDSIYLFPGSYYWDGTCTKKYFFGLIKKTKGCGGYIKGFIENNKGLSFIKVPYPKAGKQKIFEIIDKFLVIDYEELKK